MFARNGNLLRVISLSALLLIDRLWAADWGDLRIRFVHDGPFPEPPAADVQGIDRQFCCAFRVLDESLLVHKENGGVANVDVYPWVARGAKQPPVHDAVAATENAEVRLDNTECRFTPRVVALRTSQVLVVQNLDAIAHNANFASFSNALPNLMIPAGRAKKVHFRVEESLPVAVGCSVHDWMGAFVIVKDSPYVGISDENGWLEIKNLPTGEWTFQVWHEKPRFITQVVRDGQATTWNRGRFRCTIQAELNNLGEVCLPAKLFVKK